MSIASILSVFVSVRHDIYYNEQYSSRTHGIVVYAAVHKQWTVSEIWVLVALPRVPIHHGLGWMPGAGVFFGSRSLAFCTSDCTSGYSCADPFASPWKLRHQLFCHFFFAFLMIRYIFFSFILYFGRVLFVCPNTRSVQFPWCTCPYEFTVFEECKFGNDIRGQSFCSLYLPLRCTISNKIS